MLAVIGAGCRQAEAPAEFRPDSLLRVELGLTDADEVHRVMVTGGVGEVLDPAETVIPVGAWVEFVTTDWRVHVVRFETDSLEGPARAFLEGSSQAASPPLVERDARFVVSFADAPVGRYPFVTEGNGSPTRGVVVVLPSR